MNLADVKTITFLVKELTCTNRNHGILSNNWKLKVAVELRQHERAVEIRTRKRAWAKILELILRW